MLHITRTIFVATDYFSRKHIVRFIMTGILELTFVNNPITYFVQLVLR